MRRDRKFFQIAQHQLGPWELSLLLGRPLEEISALMYVSSEGHRLLGQPVRAIDLRLKSPRFCPTCVRQKGYLEAHWDCSLVIVCPTHRVRLLKSCGSCGRALSWVRPGILQCSCGADLDPLGPQPSVPSALVDMTSWIASLIRGDSAGLRLDVGLRQLRDSGRRACLRETTRRVTDERLMEYAADAWVGIAARQLGAITEGAEHGHAKHGMVCLEK